MGCTHVADSLLLTRPVPRRRTGRRGRPVFVNGKVWTVDAAKPEAEAVAVWRDRILKVGTDAEVKPLVGPEHEGHRPRRAGASCRASTTATSHFLGGGQQLARVELKDAKDEAEFGQRLAEFDKKLPRDRWMVGGTGTTTAPSAGKLPTAATVDKYVKDRPVFIRRYDGHMALANTAALKLAGVTADTKDPPGGVIYRSPTARRRPASSGQRDGPGRPARSRTRRRARSSKPCARR